MEAGALAHSSSSRGERGSPCFKSISPQPAMGHPALAPATPTQAWPRWFTGGPLQSSLLSPSAPGVLSFPAGPSLPQPRLPSEPPLRSRTHQGWGHRPSFRAASGAKSQDEVGGPQGSLGRASLSGPFGPWPQGGPQSRHRRHLGGGRGRGLHAPRKGAGKISVNPRRAPVGGNEQGSCGSGAPRPQVTRAQGDRGDAGPVPAREPKSEGSEGSEGAGIPSAHARYSPGSAPSGIRSVQSRSAGSGFHRGLCPAESELAPVGARDTLSPDPERPRSGTCGVRSCREGPLSPAPRSSRGDNALAAQSKSTVGTVRNRRIPGGGAMLAVGTRSPPGRAESARGREPGRAGSGGPGAGGRGAGRRGGGEKSERRKRGEGTRGEGARGEPGGPGRTGLAASAPPPPARWLSARRLASPRAPGLPVGPPGAGSGWASLGRLAPPCPAGLRGPGPAPRAPRRPRPGRPRPGPPPPAGLAARAGAGSLKGRPAGSAPLASAL